MATTKVSPAPLNGGTLEKNPPAEVFRRLYVERATAQVLISRLGEERTFWFRKGRLLAASSSREAQQVGELLRTFGLADERILFAAFEQALADPGRGLARALHESGAVEPWLADACVRALAEKILYSTFTWGSGTFTVTPLAELPEVPAAFDQPNGTLVLEGLRRLPPETRPGARIDGKARPVLTDDLLLRYQLVTVTPEEAEVLDAVDGVKAAADVALDLRALERLQAIGLVRVFPAGRPVVRSDGQDGTAFLNVELSGGAPSPRAAELLELQSKTIWNTYRRLDWISLYDVLGVPQDAPDPDVRRAVHERARFFHPDNQFRSPLAEAREALEALFAKVVAADAAFRTPTSRLDYDRTLASGAMSSTVQFGRPSADVQAQVAKANYQRARTLMEMEDYYPAYEMLRQAVEFDPDKPDYWILLAKVQRKNPKWVRQATETLRRATGRMPEVAELWWHLAEAYQHERNEVERVKALKEVLKLDPTHRRATAALSEIKATKPK